MWGVCDVHQRQLQRLTLESFIEDLKAANIDGAEDWATLLQAARNMARASLADEGEELHEETMVRSCHARLRQFHALFVSMQMAHALDQSSTGPSDRSVRACPRDPCQSS